MKAPPIHACFSPQVQVVLGDPPMTLLSHNGKRKKNNEADTVAQAFLPV